ncbi:MAG: hypothetical protein IJS54_07150 [Desulfovibrio sp.]|nr:hypothetical protein [Desulfovibrio sp.]
MVDNFHIRLQGWRFSLIVQDVCQNLMSLFALSTLIFVGSLENKWEEIAVCLRKWEKEDLCLPEGRGYAKVTMLCLAFFGKSGMSAIGDFFPKAPLFLWKHCDAVFGFFGKEGCGQRLSIFPSRLRRCGFFFRFLGKNWRWEWGKNGRSWWKRLNLPGFFAFGMEPATREANTHLNASRSTNSWGGNNE